MALPNLFSRRRREAAGERPEVYHYDDMSPKLRHQLLQIFQSGLRLLGWDGWTESREFFLHVNRVLREELGRPALARCAVDEDYVEEFNNWFINEVRVVHLLDAIEIVCRLLTLSAGKRLATDEIESLKERINGRMLEDGFGYQLVQDDIIRISDEYAHAEIVVPALMVLRGGRFSAANDEFLKAHAEFRAGEYADCITDCGKSLESVLKVMAGERGWTGVDGNSTLAALIKAAAEQGLFPAYMQEQITHLRAMIQGPGTIRNKDGAHGQGERPSQATQDLAAYQLHQTAAAIIFLAGR